MYGIIMINNMERKGREDAEWKNVRKRSFLYGS